MPWSFEEHTGEVRLRLRAGSLPGLFEQAARALAELMCTEHTEPKGEPIEATARASDRESLLAAWIDELVFLSETRKRVWSEVHVQRLSDTEIVASVRGFEPAALRTQVKAATLHELHVVQTPGGTFEATLVLDV
jgi:SHS2 domain-containing protein